MVLPITEIERVLDELAEMPRRVAAAAQRMSSAQLHTRPDEESWSANDILAHLCACADVWGGSIQKMLREEHPTMRYVSPRTWMKKTNFPELRFEDSFQAYTQQRSELLNVLKSLGPEEWRCGATFTGTTRGREHTIFSYAVRIIRHEQEHCQQIEALVERIEP